MSIHREQELAAKYFLQRDKTGMLVISLDNVARAEAMINSNPRYRQEEVKNSIQHLAVYIDKKQLLPAQDYKPIFTKIVSSINAKNSTRMSADDQAKIVDYLVLEQSRLIARLYNRDYCLICEIVNSATNKNYSFATKFCHYMCYWLFQDKRQQDNFSIYDNVVARILGQYAALCGIYRSDGSEYELKDFSNYKQYAIYSEVIDRIRATVSGNISRNGFDHLLWYANK